MVAEAAVVGIADELTGQAVNAFVALKEGNETNDQVRKDLILQVRKSIGPFAAPKAVFVVEDLPKTRSGKIMRRILRKILSSEEDSLGDISTVSLIFVAFLMNSSNYLCSSPIRLLLRRSSPPFMLLEGNKLFLKGHASNPIYTDKSVTNMATAIGLCLYKKWV